MEVFGSVVKAWVTRLCPKRKKMTEQDLPSVEQVLTRGFLICIIYEADLLELMLTAVASRWHELASRCVCVCVLVFPPAIFFYFNF